MVLEIIVIIRININSSNNSNRNNSNRNSSNNSNNAIPSDRTGPCAVGTAAPAAAGLFIYMYKETYMCLLIYVYI